jgi:signal transduction histidine kinase
LILDPTPTPDVELVPALIAVYSVAVHGGRWVAFARARVSLAAGLVWLGLDDFLLPTVMFGGAWLAGRLVRQRQIYAQVFAERARVLERERDANARVAAAEERVRLARELHDAVGHSVSVMVVQAGAERLVLGEERPATREALLAIERTGREALAEMSRLLGLLRKEGEGLALAPRPSLAQVGALVQTVRDAGVPVELRVEGEPRLLPASVDVSGYRILQEALTNVVKHAGGLARASVAVRYRGGEVEVEVSDDGQGPVNGPRWIWACGDARAGRAARRHARGRSEQWRRLPREGHASVRDGVALSVRVVIADDQALVRAGFRKLLERSIRRSKSSRKPATGSRADGRVRGRDRAQAL